MVCTYGIPFVCAKGMVFVGCQILVENTWNGEERCHDACELPRRGGRMSRNRIECYFSTSVVQVTVSEHYLTVTLMLNLNFGNAFEFVFSTTERSQYWYTLLSSSSPWMFLLEANVAQEVSNQELEDGNKKPRTPYSKSLWLGPSRPCAAAYCCVEWRFGPQYRTTIITAMLMWKQTPILSRGSYGRNPRQAHFRPLHTLQTVKRRW